MEPVGPNCTSSMVNCTTPVARSLSEEECCRLKAQDTRLVSEYQAANLEKQARKYWDLFYKRNETRFFKDRHWTTREFEELLGEHVCTSKRKLMMLEAGCGVGNLVYPLLEESLNLFVYACDLSPKAIELVKSHNLYSEERIQAFQADITTDPLLEKIDADSLDLATMIFVLSAIHPEKFNMALTNIYKVLKPGGMILFRDYGLHDMAQLRFKPGHKIADNHYMRQDGTRSYYFSTQLLEDIFTKAGYTTLQNTYIWQRTINKKEGIDVPRIFVQAKFQKPIP